MAVAVARIVGTLTWTCRRCTRVLLVHRVMDDCGTHEHDDDGACEPLVDAACTTLHWHWAMDCRG